MTRTVSMLGGTLGLLCGILLLLQSTARLRADPTFGAVPVCPHVDLSAATTDCVASSPCSSSNTMSMCLGLNNHWKVATFPLECVSVDESTLCNSVSTLCQTYLKCTWDDEFGCTTALIQPNPPATNNALKLVSGNCP